MTVAAVTLHRIRLTGPHPLWPSDSEGSEGLHISGRGVLRLRSGFRLQAPAPLTPALRLNLQVRIPCGPQIRKDLRAFIFPAEGSFGSAQDFGCRLPLRSRLHCASTYRSASLVALRFGRI